MSNAPLAPAAIEAERRMLTRLRVASLIEATTLAFLVLVAVPLKHLYGLPQIVSATGPIHGLAFLAYLWIVTQSLSESRWSRGEVVRLIVCAFVPLAGFVNERMLKRRQDALVTVKP